MLSNAEVIRQWKILRTLKRASPQLLARIVALRRCVFAVKRQE